MKTSQSKLKPKHRMLLDEYSEVCRQEGNSEWTLDFKYSTCEEFFAEMIEYGKELPTLDAATVGKICTTKRNKNKWCVYRKFLHFLFEKNEIQRDLSIVVPIYREKQPLPSVYSIGEVQQIENMIIQSTTQGKKDYAIVLLASRMGLRRSDIADLDFDSVDFTYNKIHLLQKKTGEELELPLVPAVKNAIINYLTATGIDTRQGKVFPDITPNYITVLVRQLMLKSGININGRRLGPHSLRSSMATSMVNDGVSYEVIRRILGHNDHNTVRKYAKLDIERLRRCALKVPAPTGIYEQLMGEGDFS